MQNIIITVTNCGFFKSILEEQINQYQCQPPITSEAVIENLLLFEDYVLFFGSPFFFLSQFN